MPEDDFDVESLAAYLHLAPAQVARLVERGRLPGRRVTGQWRFSPAEIHHWLEERIGVSNDEELAEMEGVLQNVPGLPSRPPACLLDMLPREAIAIPLDARTRRSVVTSMADLAGRTGLLWDSARMADAVWAREELMPTAQECGVALLHPRRPLASILAQPLLALGRTDRAIPFGGPRGATADVFFLICSLDDRGHLQTLARLSRLVGDDEFLAALRQAPDAPTARELIAQREAQLPG